MEIGGQKALNKMLWPKLTQWPEFYNNQEVSVFYTIPITPVHCWCSLFPQVKLIFCIFKLFGGLYGQLSLFHKNSTQLCRIMISPKSLKRTLLQAEWITQNTNTKFNHRRNSHTHCLFVLFFFSVLVNLACEFLDNMFIYRLLPHHS